MRDSIGLFLSAHNTPAPGEARRPLRRPMRRPPKQLSGPRPRPSRASGSAASRSRIHVKGKKENKRTSSSGWTAKKRRQPADGDKPPS